MTADPARRVAPEEALAWIRISLERSAAQARANGFPGATVHLEDILAALPDTPTPDEHV